MRAGKFGNAEGVNDAWHIERRTIKAHEHVYIFEKIKKRIEIIVEKPKQLAFVPNGDAGDASAGMT